MRAVGWRLVPDGSTGRPVMPDQSQHAPAATTRTLRRVLALGAASTLLLAALGPPALAASKSSVAHRTSAKITRVHQTHLAKSAPGEDDGANPETGPRENEELDLKAPGSQQAKRVPAAHVPTPAGLAVTGAGGAAGFDGQTHADQRLA